MGKLNSTLHWLTQPAASLSGPDRRRAYLLAWLLLSLILLIMVTLVLVLMVDPAGSSHRSTYLSLTSGLILLLIFAYLLNRTGHYYLAAGLTMAYAVAGPWSSVLLDPTILEGDFVPLTYVALSILLSSILLLPAFTVLLAVVQLLALALLSLFSPVTAFTNWPSLLAMIFFTSVLSLVVNVINQRDMEQIEQQTHQLAHSNGLIQSLAHITTDIERVVSPDQILQVMGENLRNIELTCVIATYHKARDTLTLDYTSMEPQILKQLEVRLGLPLLGYEFASSKLSHGTDQNDLSQARVVTNPGEVIQIFFTQRKEPGFSTLLEGVGIGQEGVLLRLPFFFEENLLGILWVWGKNLTQADLPSMNIFAKHIGATLERARLFQEVQALALVDALTGLHNRRSLFELGKVEFSRAARMQRPLSCMMLDIDHFKLINDDYGHAVGDQVLRQFANLCRSSVREIDLIGRYGGEEFVILLPETELGTGLQAAERLRACIAGTPMQVSEQSLHITVSMGLSMKDENTPDLETLIARADQALYMAKHTGRNRVEMSK